VDAAALAAASQYRQARSSAEITADAKQFLSLQGFASANPFTVDDCTSVSAAASVPFPPTAAYGSGSFAYTNPDSSVCTYPVRKLVRVRATTNATLVFLPAFRFFAQSIPLQADAVAEAASLEIMLVIDVSPSMAYDAPTGNPYRSAATCNSILAHNSTYWPASMPADYSVNGVVYSPVHSCRPFEYVRDAAVEFVDQFVKFPYDRVGIVTFCNSAFKNQSIGSSGSSDNAVQTLQQLRSLDVCTPSSTPLSQSGSCLASTWSSTALGGLGPCMATDTGDGLKLARQDLIAYSRPNSLRFLILLSDGSANGSDSQSATYGGTPHYACPKNIVSTDTNYDKYADTLLREYCNDGDSRKQTYHNSGDILYDADDYARDQAVAYATMNNMIMFTVGLGDAVKYNPLHDAVAANDCPTDAYVYGSLATNSSQFWRFSYGTTAQPLCNADSMPAGEQLLRFIADEGDGDGVDYTSSVPGPCGRDNTTGLYTTTIGVSCGNYFFAASGSELQALFRQVAQHIFTRITQ